MSMKIYMLNGPRAGEKIELLPETTIGRELDNHLSLMADGVSRYHAKFIHEKDGSWSVCDLNSTNGTKVNSERISGTIGLKEGDIVEFGDQSIRVGEPLEEDMKAAESAAAPADSPVLKPSTGIFNFTPDPLPDDDASDSHVSTSKPVFKPVSSGQTPKVVFKPIDTMASAPVEDNRDDSIPDLADDKDLFSHHDDKTMTIPDKAKGEHDHDYIADMMNKVSLFGGDKKGHGEKHNEDSAKNGKRRRSSNLMFYTLVICSAVIVFGIFVILQKQQKRNEKPIEVKEKVFPFLLVYEKTIGSRDNVFKFSLIVENNQASFTIDDLKSQRHFSKSFKEIKKESLKMLERAVEESDFMKLSDPTPAASTDDNRDIRSLTICNKDDLNRINVVNTLAPTSFDSIERAIDDFAAIYGLQTISMTPEELIEKAKQFFYKAESLYRNYKANPGNLREAQIRYDLTIEYLDQFSPKPEIWHKAMERRKELAGMIKDTLAALKFDFEKYRRLKQYDNCIDTLEQFMLVSEPGSKQWKSARDNKIILERMLKRQNRR